MLLRWRRCRTFKIELQIRAEVVCYRHRNSLIAKSTDADTLCLVNKEQRVAQSPNAPKSFSLMACWRSLHSRLEARLTPTETRSPHTVHAQFERFHLSSIHRHKSDWQLSSAAPRRQYPAEAADVHSTVYVVPSQPASNIGCQLIKPSPARPVSRTEHQRRPVMG